MGKRLFLSIRVFFVAQLGAPKFLSWCVMEAIKGKQYNIRVKRREYFRQWRKELIGLYKKRATRGRGGKRVDTGQNIRLINLHAGRSDGCFFLWYFF